MNQEIALTENCEKLIVCPFHDDQDKNVDFNFEVAKMRPGFREDDLVNEKNAVRVVSHKDKNGKFTFHIGAKPPKPSL